MMEQITCLEGEFINRIIEAFEDFLKMKNIKVPNPELKENGVTDETATIYGTDYGFIQNVLIDILDKYGVDKYLKSINYHEKNNESDDTDISDIGEFLDRINIPRVVYFKEPLNIIFFIYFNFDAEETSINVYEINPKRFLEWYITDEEYITSDETAYKFFTFMEEECDNHTAVYQTDKKMWDCALDIFVSTSENIHRGFNMDTLNKIISEIGNDSLILNKDYADEHKLYCLDLKDPSVTGKGYFIDNETFKVFKRNSEIYGHYYNGNGDGIVSSIALIKEFKDGCFCVEFDDDGNIITKKNYEEMLKENLSPLKSNVKVKIKPIINRINKKN